MPSLPRFSVAGENPDSLPPGSFEITLGIVEGHLNSGSFPKTAFASYAGKTRVEMVASGVIGKVRIQTGESVGNISPRGEFVAGSCYNYVVLDFRRTGNLYGGGWAGLCNARLTDTLTLEGTGTAARTAGYPYAGYANCGGTGQDPCYRYGNAHFVRLRPVARQLELLADSTHVTSGSIVRFTARRKDANPFTVVEWIWRPLSPVVSANGGTTTYGPSATGCSTGPICDVQLMNTEPLGDTSMAPQRGLMYVRALVDGVIETAKLEVLVERDLPPVHVTLPSGATDVLPVISRVFSAVAQKWNHSPSPQERRRDIVELAVSADFDTMRYDWVRVQFVASAIDASGGHPHGAPRPNQVARPTGSFFPTREQAETHQGRTTDSVTVDLRVNAMSASLVFRTSGVAGVELIQITATARPKGWVTDRPVSSSTKSINVKFNGLSAMSRDGAYHYFKDQSGARHGNINHYADASFSEGVLAAFEHYARYFDDTAGAPRFAGLNEQGQPETKFVITEVSLGWGGLLDYKAGLEWSNPHRLHRTGEDMDVRLRTPGQTHDLFDSRRLRVLKRICLSHGVKCDLHPVDTFNHLHLSPVTRRTPL